MHVYEIRPRKDHHDVDLISDVLPVGRLWYDTPDNAIGYAMHSSRSHDAVIRVYDAGDNMNHLVGIYLVTAVVKVTTPAFPVCATCSRTIDMSRSLIAEDAFADRKLSANASCKA